MPKYKKIPIEVEAYQLTIETLETVERWCGGQIKGMKLPPEHRCIDIQTYKGEIRAEIGDYIVKDIDGEFYTYTPISFKSLYEPSLQV